MTEKEMINVYLHHAVTEFMRPVHDSSTLNKRCKIKIEFSHLWACLFIFGSGRCCANRSILRIYVWFNINIHTFSSEVSVLCLIHYKQGFINEMKSLKGHFVDFAHLSSA